MEQIKVVFDLLLGGQNAPIGYQKTGCHIIFDIKMEDFPQKARLVVGSHDRDPWYNDTCKCSIVRDFVYCPDHCCPEQAQGQSSWHHECLHHCPDQGEDLDSTRPRFQKQFGENSSHCPCILQTEILWCYTLQAPGGLHGTHGIQCLFGWPWPIV